MSAENNYEYRKKQLEKEIENTMKSAKILSESVEKLDSAIKGVITERDKQYVRLAELKEELKKY